MDREGLSMDDLISRQAAINAYILHTTDYLVGEKPRRAFTEVLRELPSAQQWIPCSERLPEEEGTYIVTFDKRCLREDEIQVSDAIWKDNQWQYQMLESFEKRMPRLVVEPIDELKIIAWMPLPEPWRGEEA